MKTQLTRRLLCSLIAAPALLWTGVQAHAADIKERTLRFAFVQPKDSHMGYGAQKFADLVAQKSGNKIQVKLFANGTLGGDLQTVSALQGGTIDLTTMPPGLLVGLKQEFGALDLPFLFNDFAEADAVLDGPVCKQFMDAAAEARTEQRRVSREMEAKALSDIKKKGVVVTEVSPQERSRMREKVKPVTDRYVKEIGEDVVNAFYAEIEKVRTAR